jgi:uncharacterized protein (DUF1330 family)
MTVSMGVPGLSDRIAGWLYPLHMGKATAAAKACLAGASGGSSRVLKPEAWNMAAYIIADITVTDREGFEEYRRAVPAVIAAHGGRYVVRGAPRTLLEGSPASSRLVILEFPDMERLRAFWSSPDYAPLKALRMSSSTCRIEAVEGHPP